MPEAGAAHRRAIGRDELTDLQSIRNERQRAEPPPGGVENRVGDRRSQAYHRALAGTHRRNIFSVEQHGFELGNVAEPGHAIFRHATVQNFAILKFDGFKQRAAKALYIRSFDLIPQIVGIDDGTAIECRDDANHVHAAGVAINLDFCEGGAVSEFFVAPARAESLAVSFALTPSELLGRSLEY